MECIGQYTVRSVLGEGHFGTVYLAEGDTPGRGTRGARHKVVAIKQLRGEWTMRGFETLVREFELLDRVKHRSMCKVYEFLDRENAVVMEHVEGVTLRQLLDTFASLKEPIWSDAVLEIGCEIADCLFQAHATPTPQGDAMLLVHRDIKPENIMLTPTGEIKVLDFGLARFEDGAREVGVKGTPLYMAPEQARGEQVEHRTDLFALGLVLFELLTGHAAYPVPSRDRDSVIDALMERIERADLAREQVVLEREHPAIAAVIRRCLMRDPADRPADGHVLMLELRRCTRQRGALADFAAYAFGPLGPLAHLAPRSEGENAEGKARSLQPAVHARGARANPRVNSPPPRDMLSSLSDAQELPEPTTMSKPSEPARPPGTPRPSAAARPRPTPTLKPPNRPSPPKMWAPPESGGSAPTAPSGGELRMVPLHEEEGQDSSKGSTSFFAVPNPPKRDREEPSNLRRVDPIAAASAPHGAMSAAPGGYVPGAYVPGGAVPPSSMVPMAPIGIQGPIAGPYGLQPAQIAPDLQQDVERARSYRVFAVVGGLMFMAFSAMIVAVLLLASVVMFPSITETDGPIAVIDPKPIPPRSPAVDTGDVKLPDLPKDAKKPKPPGPVVPKEPKPPAPSAPPKPTTAPGTVTITLAPGSPPFTSFEVACTSENFRQRAPFSGGTASLPGVPRSDCRLYFKGGTPASIPIQGGSTLTCSFIGASPNCK